MNESDYIRDLFYLIREAAAEARHDKVKARDNEPETAAHFEGRESALIEVLLLMQSQADAFALSREAMGMSGFDPVKDDLAPPDVSRDL